MPDSVILWMTDRDGLGPLQRGAASGAALIVLGTRACQLVTCALNRGRAASLELLAAGNSSRSCSHSALPKARPQSVAISKTCSTRAF